MLNIFFYVSCVNYCMLLISDTVIVVLWLFMFNIESA